MPKHYPRIASFGFNMCNFHELFFLLKIGQSQTLFVYFRPFLVTISIIQIEKVSMVCLGFEPVAVGW